MNLVSLPFSDSFSDSPFRIPRSLKRSFLEDSDGFVASTAAPIATGRNVQLAGRDSHPLEKHHLCTAYNKFTARCEFSDTDTVPQSATPFLTKSTTAKFSRIPSHGRPAEYFYTTGNPVFCCFSLLDNKPHHITMPKSDTIENHMRTLKPRRVIVTPPTYLRDWYVENPNTLGCISGPVATSPSVP
jgi:hypothetical protein